MNDHVELAGMADVDANGRSMKNASTNAGLKPAVHSVVMPLMVAWLDYRSV